MKLLLNVATLLGIAMLAASVCTLLIVASAYAEPLIDAIARRYRRLVHCRKGDHRECVGPAFGSLWLVCLDCDHLVELGRVCPYGTNRRSRRAA